MRCRYSFAVVCLAVGLILAACGGTSNEEATDARSSSGASLPSESELEAQLLTISDLPFGWVKDGQDGDDDEDDDSGIFKDRCEILADQVQEAPIKVSAGFSLKSEKREFSQSLGGWESADAAQEEINDALKFFDRCSSYSSYEDEIKVDISTGKLSFPTLGDQTAAFYVEIKANAYVAGKRKEIQLDTHSLLIRKGQLVLFIFCSGPGPGLDIKPTQEIAELAYAKLR